MTEPNLTFRKTDFTVQKIGYQMPMSCCLLDSVECQHPPAPRPTRRQQLRWWLARLWERRPRVHLGPCDHEDCSW